MATTKRAVVTAETLKAIGAEHAGMRISAAKAKTHAQAYEALLSEIAKLRTLPLKNVEPAMVFAPLYSDQGDGDD